MTAKIGALNVSLGLDSAKFTSGAKKAQAQMTGLQGAAHKMSAGMKGAFAGFAGGIAAMGVTGLASALGSAVVKGIEFASSLGETAQQLGVSSTALQEYRHIASQVGIEQAEMDKGLSFLTKTLGQLSLGAKGPADALKKLGFDAAETARIAKMSAGDAIPVLADAFAKLKNPTEQAALAAQLFGGKLGPKFLTLLTEGSQGINNLRKEAHDLGLVLTPEQIAKADDAADKYAKLKNVISTRIAASAADNAGAMVKVGEAAGAMAVAFINAAGKIVEAGSQTRVAYDNYVVWANGMAGRVVAAFNRMVEGIRNSIINGLKGALDYAKGLIQSVADKFKWLDDVVVRNSYVPDMVTSIGEHMARLDALMVQPVQAATSKAAEAFRALQGTVSGILSRLFPEQARHNQFLTELKALQDYAAQAKLPVDQLAEAVRRLRAEYLDAQFGPAGQPEIFPEGLPEIVPIGDTDNLGSRVPDLTRGGLSGRLQGLVTVLEQIRATSYGTFGSMADQIVSAVIPAIDAMGDATASVGQKIGAVGNAFATIFGAIFGKKVGRIVGAVAQIGATFAGGFGGARAKGGPVGPGKAFLVGEKGPELFVPREMGSIVSHTRLPSVLDRVADIQPERGPAMRVEIIPSQYFDVVVDGRIQRQAPALVAAGASAGSANAQAAMYYRQTRKIG